MNRLVGDLLSLSRFESEERVRPRDRIELTAVVRSVLRTLDPVAEEAGVALEDALGPSSVHVVGDADQLVQVFTNLIENAVKYGHSGQRVTVRLELIARDPGLRGSAVQVDVIDYGPGIDDVHLPRMTERFYRIDNHRSRAMGGTGLGLAIVKHILNRHRGRLKVTSELGKGTCFSVILPGPEAA